ncbi:hypothetical protein FACS1894110_19670 [Spirochaetia bacterium]|nr:hypothetical protein FACS1894110_19670 [Spirochaetia bacterium]
MENIKQRVVFFSQLSTQPRYIKRMQLFIDKGFDVTVVSFERNRNKKNIIPREVAYLNLGTIDNGNYIKRLPVLLKSIYKMRSVINNGDLLYFFSDDIFILLPLLMKNKNTIYYELGDITAFNIPFLKVFYYYIYGKILKKTDKIYVTSPAFKDYLINKYNIRNNIEIVENKLIRKSFLSMEKPHFRTLEYGEIFTIGIIGFLCYPNILWFMNEYIKNDNRFRICLFGDGPLLDDLEYFINKNQIKYFGTFKYPDDLENIYKQTDLSFIMYNSNILNVRLALPNKLYESMFFKRPVLVTKNTFLAEKVSKYGIGFCWNQNEMADLIEYLNSREFIQEYNSLKDNFETIKELDYFETVENI